MIYNEPVKLLKQKPTLVCDLNLLQPLCDYSTPTAVILGNGCYVKGITAPWNLVMEGLEPLNLNFIGYANRCPGICQLKAKTIHPLNRGDLSHG